MNQLPLPHLCSNVRLRFSGERRWRPRRGAEGQQRTRSPSRRTRRPRRRRGGDHLHRTPRSTNTGDTEVFQLLCSPPPPPPPGLLSPPPNPSNCSATLQIARPRPAVPRSQRTRTEVAWRSGHLHAVNSSFRTHTHTHSLLPGCDTPDIWSENTLAVYSENTNNVFLTAGFCLFIGRLCFSTEHAAWNNKIFLYLCTFWVTDESAADGRNKVFEQNNLYSFIPTWFLVFSRGWTFWDSGLFEQRIACNCCLSWIPHWGHI